MSLRAHASITLSLLLRVGERMGGKVASNGGVGGVMVVGTGERGDIELKVIGLMAVSWLE